MTDWQTILLAVAGWLATTWLAFRWGLHSQKISREEATKGRIKLARVDFVGFLRSWMSAFSRKIYKAGGWERDYHAFFDAIPDFIHVCEHVKADLPASRREEFEERIARIRNTKHADFYKEKFDHLLSEFDGLIQFIEDA